jgi:glycosyltransferase involved in cell wall biosynthesis
MKVKYDLLFLTNCPAFYKINLFNALAEKCKLGVIFIGYSDQVVIDSDFKIQCKFDYYFLQEVKLEDRNIFLSFVNLIKVLKKIECKKIIYGGYTFIEFLTFSFLFSRNKNILQTESAHETKLTGWRFYLKKILLTRYFKAIASGKIHSEMLRKMGFNGEIIISKGVGLLNKNTVNSEKKDINDTGNLKYLYVGRLISLKNIEFLVDVFNKNKKPLTIVGKGILENELKEKANDNIVFEGFVNNREISVIYKSHDVFILPSLSEPWGLVVEEALYNSCVLLLSDRIGSKTELLEIPETGCEFNPESELSLNNAISIVENNYQKYLQNVLNFDLDKKDELQIDAYLKVIT